MKSFFQPNINRNGRVARAIIGLLCLMIGIIVSSQVERWAGLILIVAGLFALFEALSKWCILRACGIKIKL